MSRDTPSDPSIGAELALVTRGIRKSFGRRIALADLDLRVPRGAIYVLVGPNGSGKTTLMRILLDVVRADSGVATVLGFDSVKDGAYARAACGHVGERRFAGYAWMKVRDLLAFQASYRPTWDKAYADALTKELDVRDHTTFGKLSKGEARRLQLVMTLAHRPSVLLLDEPTDGLDPVMRDRALRLLSRHLAENETSVLISTHLVSEVEGLGDQLGVLRDGVLSTQIDRVTLRTTLHSYTITAPIDWAGVPSLSGRIVSKYNGIGQQLVWIVWGDEREVVGKVTATGATVREVRQLSLERAAVYLMSERLDFSGTAPTSIISGAGGGK